LGTERHVPVVPVPDGDVLNGVPEIGAAVGIFEVAVIFVVPKQLVGRHPEPMTASLPGPTREGAVASGGTESEAASVGTGFAVAVDVAAEGESIGSVGDVCANSGAFSVRERHPIASLVRCATRSLHDFSFIAVPQQRPNGGTMIRASGLPRASGPSS
jgi:hypothetical protein